DGNPRDSRPEIWAWAAVAHIDDQGQRCADSAQNALSIVAVSVNEAYPMAIADRVDLMRAAVLTLAARLEGKPSLWVYPAGYFGFDAAAFARGDKAAAWPGLDRGAVEDRLTEIVNAHPSGAWVAFGVDTSGESQEAWIVRAGGSGAALERHTIERGDSLDVHCFNLVPGGLNAAFFVCSEIAGYAGHLSSCRVVVDLAHVRVPGTVWSDHEGPRMLHQRELTRVAAHGAAVLTHHHAGQFTKADNPRFEQQSNWILFQGDGTDWFDSAKVEVIP
ncbi:MAG: hypothetical protein ACMG6S_18530, partial [Byssovorax sp.]